MELTATFYHTFYTKLREAFANEWPDGIDPTNDPKVWTLKVALGPVKGKPGAKHTPDAIKQLLGVNERYYYNFYRNVVNKAPSVDPQDASLIIAFRYLDCVGRGLATLIQDFCARYAVEETISNPQLELLALYKENPRIVQTPPPPQPETSMKGIGSLARRYLPGTSWWLYSYGYELPKNTEYRKDPNWKLLSLVLSFVDEGGANLTVDIKNKKDKDHFDYKGTTDFDNQSSTVLAMRLYTDPGKLRMLNINMNIGTGSGSLFLGQYLNYDQDGYIFSGSLIMEYIDPAKYPDPQPCVYTIPRKAVKPEDYPEEVRHIAFVLQDRQLNFRRMPTDVHNLTDLENWQERRRKRKET